jgi:hypothetical protein
MAYTEYSLIILSRIVLAKFSITSREIYSAVIAIDFPCKLVVLNREFAVLKSSAGLRS